MNMLKRKMNFVIDVYDIYIYRVSFILREIEKSENHSNRSENLHLHSHNIALYSFFSD